MSARTNRLSSVPVDQGLTVMTLQPCQIVNTKGYTSVIPLCILIRAACAVEGGPPTQEILAIGILAARENSLELCTQHPCHHTHPSSASAQLHRTTRALDSCTQQVKTQTHNQGQSSIFTQPKEYVRKMGCNPCTIVQP